MKKYYNLLALFLLLFISSCKDRVNKNISLNERIIPAQEEKKVASKDSPVHLNKSDFLRLVMDYEKNPEVWKFKGEKPCLIDFYADWCAPCKITSPILEDLAKQYAGKITIYKVDVDVEQELAAVFGVQSIPTFLFCPVEGKPTISTGIANTPEATKAMFIQQIEELLIKQDSTVPTI